MIFQTLRAYHYLKQKKKKKKTVISYKLSVFAVGICSLTFSFVLTSPIVVVDFMHKN